MVQQAAKWIVETTSSSLAWFLAATLGLFGFLHWHHIEQAAENIAAHSELKSRMSVIESSRFTNKDAEKLRDELREVKGANKESVAITNGKLDIINLNIKLLREQFEQQFNAKKE